MVPLVVLFAPFLRRDHGLSEAASQVAVPWRPIVLVGLALVLFYMVDTAATTWGATYLDDTFSAPEDLVALATFPYLVASLACSGSRATAWSTGTARWRCCGSARSSRPAALAVVVFAPTLAGGGGRVHPARRGHGRDRPVELLRRRPDRRRGRGSIRRCGTPGWTP